MEGLGCKLRPKASPMTIVITPPRDVPDEASRICRLLTEGKADIVHIRKPDWQVDQVESLIADILAICQHQGIALQDRLTLHDWHNLAARYSLGGIHLNARHPLPPPDWHGRLSRSCHTMEETIRWKQSCDYVSLSPIFDSISKPGYKSSFTKGEIEEALGRGIIDRKVMALGGVTFERLPLVREMGFGGGMILGDAWKMGGD